MWKMTNMLLGKGVTFCLHGDSAPFWKAGIR